jgi:hypothetical protein
MPLQSWEPLYEGDQPSADQLRDLFREVERLGNLVPAAPLEIEEHHGGYLFRINESALASNLGISSPFTSVVNDQTGTTTYNVTQSDAATTIVFNSASPVTVNLPATTNLAGNFSVTVQNLGTGNVTLTPPVGTTLNLLTSLVLPPGQSTTLAVDGANYIAQPGGGGQPSPGYTPVNAQTGTSYTIATTDRGSLVTFNNASPVAATIPTAGSSGFPNGFTFAVENIGAGTVTLTPATGTLNGLASLALLTGQGGTLTVSGANYVAQTGGAGRTVGVTASSNHVTGTTPAGTMTVTNGSGSTTFGCYYSFLIG